MVGHKHYRTPSPGCQQLGNEKEQAAVLSIVPATERQGRHLRSLHHYRDSGGRIIFSRLRLDPDAGTGLDKYIRPIHWERGRPRIGMPKSDALLPILNLPLIQTLEPADGFPAVPVWIVEGEKCVDHLAEQFIMATTSGSSGSAGKHDWSVLKGREVIIWPDNDEPGF